MSKFYIKAWIVSGDVVAVECGETPIETPALSPSGATELNAIGQGEYINAGDLFPTLTYSAGALTSTLCEIEAVT